MPLDTFFTAKTPPTRKAILTKIHKALCLNEDVNSHLKSKNEIEQESYLWGGIEELLTNPKVDEPFKDFYNALYTRLNDFEKALSNNQFKHAVLMQYERFASALNDCSNHPIKLESATKTYFKSYYCVGIMDLETKNPILVRLAEGTAGLGLGLLCTAIIGLLFHAIISAMILALSLTLLIPASFSLLTPASPDTTKMQDFEKNIFQSAAELSSHYPAANQSDKLEQPFKQKQG